MRLSLFLSLFVLSLFVFTLTSACSDDTGILIRTSTSADFDSSIHSLRFYVGEDSIGEPSYYSDDDPGGDVLLKGRDIAEEPYRLLLHPESEDMNSIVVAAIALDDAGKMLGFGRLAEPVDFINGKVAEWDLVIGPLGTNVGDVTVTDTGCLVFHADTGETVHIGTPGDLDCDGVIEGDGPQDDCNDLAPFQSPQSPEDCFNGIDDNCNNAIDSEDILDSDGDTFPACGPSGTIDCNDSDAAINSEAEELCDGIDNNCDNHCDEGYDLDEDGYSVCGSVIEGNANATTCVAMDHVDCNDLDYRSFPGNPEVCDGIDNDCNDECDEDSSLDPDKDGYTDCGSIIGQCGTHANWDDCAPDDNTRHPGAHELCDGIDNNCDGELDPGTTPCFADTGDTTVLICQEGFRTCLGGTPSTCIPDNGPILADQWCTTYSTCEQDNTITDPFVCSLEQAASTGNIEICRVRMLSPSQVCPGRNAKIALSDGSVADAQCSYTIVGDGHQQGYKLTLNNFLNLTNTRTVYNSCEVGLNVGVFPQGLWPGDATFSILFQDRSAGGDVEVQLELQVELVESCGVEPGLVCETWLTGPWATPVP